MFVGGLETGNVVRQQRIVGIHPIWHHNYISSVIASSISGPARNSCTGFNAVERHDTTIGYFVKLKTYQHVVCLYSIPIALTSLLMKSFERIVLKYMLPQVEHLLDPLQFAYRTKRSVEDATLSMLNVILEHLERRGSYARILFVDFSSAFNTIQPHLMIRKTY